MTEIEWKLALSRREYERLLRALGPGRGAEVSRNRYWETTDRWLRRSGAGLRLRTCRGKRPVLTFKFALAETSSTLRSGLHRRGEHECFLSAKTAAALRAGRRTPNELKNCVGRRAAEALRGRPLVVLGDLELHRFRRPWNGLLLEVDRFLVGTTTRYEVEVECSDPTTAKRQLRTFFRDLRIPWRPRTKTKVSYLYQRRYGKPSPNSPQKKRPRAAGKRREGAK